MQGERVTWSVPGNYRMLSERGSEDTKSDLQEVYFIGTVIQNRKFLETETGERPVQVWKQEAAGSRFRGRAGRLFSCASPSIF